MFRILVPDAETRKAFDIISMLSCIFSTIPIIVGNTTGSSKAGLYLEKIFMGKAERLRTTNQTDCVEDLLVISETYKYDRIIFIPAEEETIAHFYQFLNVYGPKNFVYILPKEELYNQFRDKKGLNDFCAVNNLSAPVHYSIADIDSLTKDQYPILLKPCIGFGSKGQYRLYKPEDYTGYIRSEVSKKPYLVQELIPNGHDVQGAFYLYYDGKIIDAYSHQRLRTSPPTGGVTVLSRFQINDKLIADGKEILDRAGWNGLIMLEFLLNPKTQDYKVIEANPRVWGSIMLSEYSGRNLLSNYVRICMGEEIVNNYKPENAYIRWFFPVDVLNYIKKFGCIRGFWNFKNTCFINWSYASKKSAILFNLKYLFSLKNLKRFFRP